jgi:hypothetical protein
MSTWERSFSAPGGAVWRGVAFAVAINTTKLAATMLINAQRHKTRKMASPASRGRSYAGYDQLKRLL